MKKYIAIGTWRDDSNKNLTSVALSTYNMTSFRDDLNGNGFIPWTIISEKKFETLLSVVDDGMELFNEVKKLTSNYRRWDLLVDYVEQCIDIMQERLNNA